MAEMFLSPFGKFTGFPWLVEADVKYVSDGLFHTPFVPHNPKHAKELKDKIDAAVERVYAERTATMNKKELSTIKGKYYPYRENDDGEIEFNFKQNKIIKLRDGSEKEVSIEFRDAKDNVFEPDSVFGGSEGRVLFSMRGVKVPGERRGEFEIGIRLDFYKVQITKLKKGAAGGFGVTDGYVAGAEDQGFGEADENADPEDY